MKNTISLFTSCCFQYEPNARHEPLPEAGARDERTLEAVGSMPSLGDLERLDYGIAFLPVALRRDEVLRRAEDKTVVLEHANTGDTAQHSGVVSSTHIDRARLDNIVAVSACNRLQVASLLLGGRNRRNGTDRNLD